MQNFKNDYEEEYASLPKEKKDPLLLRKREAYARKKLLKGESSRNLTSSFNISQQTGN